MKKIKLKRLIVDNFRGMSFDYCFGDRNVISGWNKSGKTTVKNAFLWLLTGSDEDDNTNACLFDKNAPQTKEGVLPVSVTGIFDIDGQETKISRCAKMGWIRKRGAEDYEKKNTDDYTFSIDDIERSATDFRSCVEEMFAPSDKLKCMINIMQFVKNIDDWKTQRKLLSDIVGDITWDDFTGDYSELYDELDKYTPDQIREQLRNKLAPINKKLGTGEKKGEMAVELEVLEKKLAAIDVDAFIEAEKELETLKKEREDVQQQIADKSKAIEPVINERNKIMREVEKKKMAIYEHKANYRKEQESQLSEIRNRIADIERTNADIVRNNKRITDEYNRNKQAIVNTKKKIEELSKRLDDLRDVNANIKSMTFTKTECAYCGQELPAEKIEEERAKFEQGKEKMRADNVEQGKRVKFELETEKSNLEILEKETFKEPELQQIQDASALQFELNEKINGMTPFEKSEKYKSLMDEIAEIEKSMPAIPAVDTEELTAQLNDVNAKIEDVSKQANKREDYEEYKEDIKDLQARMKENAVERARLEKIMNQLNCYESEKANIIGNRVNGLLEYCRVEMFAVGKDGEQRPNCVVSDAGVDKTMNGAACIKTGIDISNAFCKHYGLLMPLFVDDVERVTDDIDVSLDRQVFLLEARKEDFRVEIIK